MLLLAAILASAMCVCLWKAGLVARNRDLEYVITRANDLLMRAQQPTGTQGAWQSRVNEWRDHARKIGALP